MESDTKYSSLHDEALPNKAKQYSTSHESIHQAKSVSFFKFFQYANGYDRFLMTIGTLSAILTGGCIPAFTFLFGDIEKDLIDHRDDLMYVANKYLILFLSIGGIAWVLSYFAFCPWIISGQRQSLQFRVKYFQVILRQEIGWFDTNNSTELSTIISNDCSAIQSALGEKIPICIWTFSMTILSFVAAFIKGWKLAGAMAGSVIIPFMILGLIYVWGVQKAATMNNKVYEVAGGHAEQALSAIRTVRSLVGEQKELYKYSKHLDHVKKVAIKYGIIAGLTLGLVFLANIGSYGFAVWYATKLINSDHYHTGNILSIVFSVSLGTYMLAQLTPVFKSFSNGKKALNRYQNMLIRIPKIDIESDVGGTLGSNPIGKVSLSRVSFTYPARPEQQILRKATIECEPNQKTALVGESGSGKSTCMQLIERFYDPDNGAVEIDGVNIKQLNLSYLRSLIGYVGQEPVLFAATIKENLLFAKPDATDVEILETLHQANAWEFVSHLPKGINTYVGSGGIQLSGGQKQRVAIARVILKNPKILLLDEATSALDRRSEREIQDILDQISKDRTTIVVAHRLSTIENANKIILMSDGEVLEQGTHEQMLLKSKKYKEMAAHQFLDRSKLEEIKEESSREKNSKEHPDSSEHRGNSYSTPQQNTSSDGDKSYEESHSQETIRSSEYDKESEQSSNVKPKLLLHRYRTDSYTSHQNLNLKSNSPVMNPQSHTNNTDSSYEKDPCYDILEPLVTTRKTEHFPSKKQLLQEDTSEYSDNSLQLNLKGTSKVSSTINEPLSPTKKKKGSAIYPAEALNQILLPNSSASSNQQTPTPVNSLTENTIEQQINQQQQQQQQQETEEGKKYSFTKTIFRLLSYSKGDCCNFFLMALFAIGTGVVFPMFSIGLSKLITIFNAPEDPDFQDKANKLALFFVALAVGMFICLAMQLIFSSIIGEKVTKNIRIDLYNKMLKMDMHWFDVPENSPGALSAKLANDPQSINSLVSSMLAIMIQSLSSMVAGITIAFIASWKVSLVTVVISPLQIIASYYFQNFLAGASSKLDHLFKESSSYQTDMITNMRTVASFGQEKLIIEKFRSYLDRPYKMAAGRGTKGGFIIGLAHTMTFVVYAVTFYFGIYFLKQGDVSMEDMYLAIMALVLAAFGIGSATQFMPDVGSARIAASNIFNILDAPIMIEGDQQGKDKLNSFEGQIEFINVSFKYPTRSNYVYKRLSFKVEPGSHVAFVGPSGCGKSTIIQLILKFYEIQSGQILLDGNDLADLDCYSVRKMMGLVSQEPVLFQGTIRENLKYTNEKESDENMKAVAQMANAIEFIEKKTKNLDQLGQGFDRLVGVKGSQLSGGQKQRIAIARAILPNPPVLLFDEATSALDSENEKLVQRSLDSLVSNKTSINIAHRLSTIRDCDVIFVLWGGKIIEQGRFNELMMNEQGHFYNLSKGANM